MSAGHTAPSDSVFLPQGLGPARFLVLLLFLLPLSCGGPGSVIEDPMPTKIDVSGPDSVVEGSVGSYVATVILTDGSAVDLTPQVSWSVIGGLGSVDDSGLYNAPESIDGVEQAILHVTYNFGELTLEASKVVAIAKSDSVSASDVTEESNKIPTDPESSTLPTDVTIPEPDTVDQDSTATVRHKISGHVRNNGVALAGVSITAEPGNITSITDETGFYEINVPEKWTGTVTARRDRYKFDPPSRSYSSMTAGIAGQDFVVAKETWENFLALGVYVYWQHVEKIVEITGRDRWEIWDQILADLSDHNCNIFFLGNAPRAAQLKRLSQLAQAHGLKFIPQPGVIYYPVGQSPDQRQYIYENQIKPEMEKMLPQFVNDEGIFGWSLVEETRGALQEEIADQRALAKTLDPTHPIMCMYSRTEAMEAAVDPLPDIFAFATYPYSYAAWLTTPEKPRDAPHLLMPSVINGTILPKFNTCSSISTGMSRPFWGVGQAFASYTMPANVDWADIPTDVKDKLEKWGKVYWAERDTWLGWSHYMAPPESLGQQCWYAIAKGAKGILFYKYTSTNKLPLHYKTAVAEHKTTSMGLVNGVDFEPTEQWTYLKTSFGELGRFADLIGKWQRDDVSQFRAEGACVATFRTEPSDATYVVVVNKNAGSWPSGQRVIVPSEGAKVDSSGQYTGELNCFSADYEDEIILEPTVDGTFVLSDLITGQEVRNNRILLKPGQGTILLAK